MEDVADMANLRDALKVIWQNQGAPGPDGETVEDLRQRLGRHVHGIRRALLQGDYRPVSPRRVTIDKDSGGERKLSIPTVQDRFVQQALLQVLQPLLDPTFHDDSYGYRPGRSAHDAVERARQLSEQGRDIVVDVDLKSFFDEVNHDILMDRVARKIKDRRVLKLIRRFLQAGTAMDNGVAVTRQEGIPQGGPLSPLLANLLLDEVDRELERRGHTFVRYADDLRVHVGSQRAGERVMRGLRKILSRLHLEINDEKSAVAPSRERPFLGFRFFLSRTGETRTAVARDRIAKFKRRVRRETRRTIGRSPRQVIKELRAYLIGWRNYYGHAKSRSALRNLNGWIRRRLRVLILAHWRWPKTIYRSLRRLGAESSHAWLIARQAGRWWSMSRGRIHRWLPVKLFKQLGLPEL